MYVPILIFVAIVAVVGLTLVSCKRTREGFEILFYPDRNKILHNENWHSQRVHGAGDLIFFVSGKGYAHFSMGRELRKNVSLPFSKNLKITKIYIRPGFRINIFTDKFKDKGLPFWATTNQSILDWDKGWGTPTKFSIVTVPRPATSLGNAPTFY